MYLQIILAGWPRWRDFTWCSPHSHSSVRCPCPVGVEPGAGRGFAEDSSHVVLLLQLQLPFALWQGPVKFPMLFSENFHFRAFNAQTRIPSNRSGFLTEKSNNSPFFKRILWAYFWGSVGCASFVRHFHTGHSFICLGYVGSLFPLCFLCWFCIFWGWHLFDVRLGKL